MKPDIIILCGGLGTRLQTAVSDRQKCVADVAGVPFLVRLIEYACHNRFRRFILCTGHQAETVQRTVTESVRGVEVVISHEEEPWGTGGAIRQAAELANGTRFIAMNGDSLCKVDFRELLDFHQAREAEATVVLAEHPENADCGNVSIDTHNRITSFVEKDGLDAPYVNAGIYVMEKSALDRFPEGRCSIEKDVFASWNSPTLFGFPTIAPLLDIGTPERLRKAEKWLGG